MRKIIKFPLILFLVGFLPGICFGQAKVGTAGAQFLEIGVSARAVGMGEAFIGMVDDASAVYYNPAGLTQLDSREVMLTHIEYPADINYEFLGLAYPTPQIGGVCGLAFYMLDAGDMVRTEHLKPGIGDVAITGETFSAKDYALTFSYARNLTDRFTLGVTFKYLNELYEEEMASGFGVDVGTLYRTGFRGFKIAMVLSNFGPDLKFIREEYPLPINFKFGGSMDVINNQEHRTIFNLEGSHPSDNLEKYHAGLEYLYKDRFALRIGKKFEYDTGGFTAGGGIKFELGSHILKVDYAYHDFGFLENSHRFSVGFNF